MKKINFVYYVFKILGYFYKDTTATTVVCYLNPENTFSISVKGVYKTTTDILSIKQNRELILDAIEEKFNSETFISASTEVKITIISYSYMFVQTISYKKKHQNEDSNIQPKPSESLRDN